MRVTDGNRTAEARDICEGSHDFGPAEHGEARECADCLVLEGDPIKGHFWQRIGPASWAFRTANGHVHRWIDVVPADQESQ